MRTIFDKVEGDMSVSDHVVIHGMVTGDITVAAGGDLVLHGMGCRALVVEPSGSAVVHGMVIGRVTNKGGKVAVHGTVGSLDETAGETHVAQSAVIRDRDAKA
jgi:hypothetical protein